MIEERKKDYLLISIIGFLFGVLLLPIIKNINLQAITLNFINAVIIIIAFIIFANIALKISFIIGRRIAVIFQFAKFAAVGGLNTLLDLGVLNLLIFLSGIATGYWYSGFKAFSFIIASINAYFWNKYWAFGVGGSVNTKEFAAFFTVSVIGFGINVGIASFLVNVIGLPAGISENLWANIGALAATVISLVWNFIGYKFIVFKR